MTPELQAACEAIFEEHKNRTFSWAKDIFHGRISTGMLDLAKETLLEKNIIFYPNRAKKTITALNPDVSKAENVEEALSIISGKPHIPALVINDKKNSLPKTEKPALVNKPPAIIRKIVTPENVEDIDRPKWYMRPLFIYFIWPVCAAILFWFIAYLIGVIYFNLMISNLKK